MNSELRKQGKNDFEKDFFKLMKNCFQEKHRDIKLVTTDKKRSKLASEPNYHTKKYFSENLLAIEMKKIKVKMNKPVYLGLSILEISKTLTQEFWYDYKQNTMQNYATWMQSALLFILKLNVFMKILLMMLKKNLMHNIMKSTDHCLQETTKK